MKQKSDGTVRPLRILLVRGGNPAQPFPTTLSNRTPSNLDARLEDAVAVITVIRSPPQLLYLAAG